LGRSGFVVVVSTTEVAGGLGFATKVSLDSLLTGGILGGDFHDLPRCAQGITTERVDESLACHAADEGVDHVDVGDVGELVALLGEALDVLPESFAGPLPIITEVP
jgi:hypothetical protein